MPVNASLSLFEILTDFHHDAGKNRNRALWPQFAIRREKIPLGLLIRTEIVAIAHLEHYSTPAMPGANPWPMPITQISPMGNHLFFCFFCLSHFSFHYFSVLPFLQNKNKVNKPESADILRRISQIVNQLNAVDSQDFDKYFASF